MIARERRRVVPAWVVFGFVMSAAVIWPGLSSSQTPPAEADEESVREEEVHLEVLRPCPQDKIVKLLQTAVTPGQISAGLALERETLKFCAERQELVLKLFRLEADIRRWTPVAKVEAPEPEVIYKDRDVVRYIEVPVERENEGPGVNLADMSFFSVFGSAASPQAGITLGDGAELFVKVGDEVDGVGTVESITINPAAVVVSGALRNPLPLRKRKAQ